MNKAIFRWESDFFKSAVRLWLPIAVQAFFTASMHVLDNLMIGQYGNGMGIELGGVTQANQVTFLFQTVMFGMVSGSSILMSQFWGKGDSRGIRQTMLVAQVTALLTALLFALPSMIAPQFIMGLLVKDPATQQAGAEYLRIISLVYLLDAVLLPHEAALKSTEHVNLPTVAGVIAIGANTLLNYLLIFGRLGFPEMGIRGAALATLIAVFLQLSLILFISYRKRYANAIRFHEIKKPPRAAVSRYVMTVLPVLLNEALWSSGVVMCKAAYGQMSLDAVASMSILGNVEQIAFITIRGMTTACSIMVGKAIGAGRKDEAQLSAQRFLFGSIVLAALTGVLVFILGGSIAEPFKVTAAAKQNAYQIIRFYALTVWLSAGCGAVIVGIMRAGGDVVFSGVIDVVFLWLIGVPLVWLCGPHLGWPIPYVYLLTRIDELCKFAVGLHRLKSRKWMHNLVEDA